MTLQTAVLDHAVSAGTLDCWAGLKHVRGYRGKEETSDMVSWYDYLTTIHDWVKERVI
jgi:hypothetical protein